MRQQIGFMLQFLILVFLPMLLFFDIDYGIKRLVVMPVILAVSAGLFFVGHKLRES